MTSSSVRALTEEHAPVHWRKRTLTAILLLAVLFAAPGAVWLFQRRLIYFPSRWLPPLESVLPGWRDVALHTEDGLEIGAWLHPPVPHETVIIVFNGNAGNRGDRVSLGAALAAEGFGVLLVDYRGYGSNAGRPTEQGLSLDARAARRYFDEHWPDHGVCYFGESLGAAVAVELATDTRPDALILRSPFTSLDDVARTHYPILPVGLLLRDRYPSLERIGELDVPLLVIAGSADSIVPPEQSEELFAAAADPVRLLMVEGADHNDYELLAGAELVEAVSDFLSR